MRACCGLASVLLSGKVWLTRIFPADYSSAKLKLCFPPVVHQPNYSPSKTRYCDESEPIIWHYAKASKQRHNERRTRSSMEMTAERLYFHEYASASVKWAVKWDSITYTALKKVLKCLKGRLKVKSQSRFQEEIWIITLTFGSHRRSLIF